MRCSSARLWTIFVALLVSHGTLFAAILGGSGSQALSLDDVSKRVLPLTVSLTGEDVDGQSIAPGSGFIVRPGVILTDYRVIKDSIRIRARSPGEDTLDVTLVAVDERLTAAVLRISPDAAMPDGQKKSLLMPSKPGGRFPLEYVQEAAAGEDVYVFSNFGRGDGSLLPSRVDELREVGGAGYLHLTGSLSSESAGGPVLNAQGHLIGMVVATPNEGAGPCFAIPARTLGGCGLDGFGAAPWEEKSGKGSQTQRSEPVGVPGVLSREARHSAGIVTPTRNGFSSGEVRTSGAKLHASAIRSVQPSYPPLARAARVSGNVVVEVTVDPAGDVISARTISGHPLLKDCIVAAARGWKFRPTLLSGMAVKVIGTITFTFTLEGSSSQTSSSGSGASQEVGVDITKQGGVYTHPVPLTHPRPSYTPEARANKTEGLVQARVLVGADGLVKEVKIIKGLPDGLNEEAIRVMHKMKFKPATHSGVNVPFWARVDVEFNLK